jgi:hypothetical protein
LYKVSLLHMFFHCWRSCWGHQKMVGDHSGSPHTNADNISLARMAIQWFIVICSCGRPGCTHLHSETVVIVFKLAYYIIITRMQFTGCRQIWFMVNKLEYILSSLHERYMLITRCADWQLDWMWPLLTICCKSCDIRHLWNQRVAGYYNFLDIRTLYLMCILVCLTTSWTELTI